MNSKLLLLCATCLVAAVSAAEQAEMSKIDLQGLRWCVGFALICALVALFAAAVFFGIVSSKDAGSQRMQEIAASIQEGATAFLTRQYFALLWFVVPAAAVVAIVNYKGGWWQTLISFLIGSFLSGLCGWLGMQTAVRANVRTAAAAAGPSGMAGALRVAFNSGSVMGLSVVGFGLLGISALFLLFGESDVAMPLNFGKLMTLEYLSGFAMGASSIALFARVAGGIYTKAADVGSDLVGKVEAGIPEDDPRNPGVIADNVGDNVGDVAGMGADLYESYVGSIISAAILGDSLRGVSLQLGDYQAVALPFVVAGLGILASIVGGLSVFCPEGASQIRLLWAMRIGVIVSATLIIILVAIADFAVLNIRWQYTLSVYIGLVAGILIGLFTEYATAFEYSPVKTIAWAGVTGPATVIIQGLGVGQLSTLPPVLIMCVTIVLCMILGDVYAVSIAAVGMLSTLGMTLATDAYGPVADNAGGIAEMAELPEEVRKKTDALDALGNTTAATGKGFAIGSAVLTALALMTAYTQRVGLTVVDLVVGDDPAVNFVIPGILFGTMMPFLFSALTMLAVGKSAGAIIKEVRRQFREIPGLLDGAPGVKADYARCVAISTGAAIREMVLPGFVAVITPIIIGLGFGAEALAGVLVGSIASGFLLAVMMANAGGAWDNAKKYVESGALPGVKKGTSIHAATVTGDTVGDPFKDTSGPSLNILIKLTSIIALTLAPAFTKSTQKDIWWVALILFFVSALAVIGWIQYVNSKDDPMEMSEHAISGGQSAGHSHGGRSRRHRSRHGGGGDQYAAEPLV